MAGSKRNRLKNVLSQSQSTAPPSDPTVDDDELMNDLIAQLDSRDTNVQSESAEVLKEMQTNQNFFAEDTSKKKGSKSRYKERQARKTEKLSKTFSPVDEAADERLKKEAQDEEMSIKSTCDELGVKIHEIPPDGHCLFSSVGDQLALLNIVPQAQAGYPAVRYAASNYIYTHADDFLPFLPSSGGEDGIGETDAGLMSRAEFERYCINIRDTGAWGGEPEILALSRAYNVPIHVVQGRNPPVVIHNPTGGPQDGHLNDSRVVRISYHRRMYGLGEHYNSLRPYNSLSHTVADKLQHFMDLKS